MADQAGNEVVVTLRLGEDTAWALAQFVKRVGWSEVSGQRSPVRRP